jgi:hypothetical protein
VFVYNFAAGGNITGKPVWMGWDTHMEQCQVDISTNKIWLLWDSWSGGEGARWHGIGWIDLTETTGYAYHPLISNDDDEPYAGGGVPNRSAMYVDNASGVIAFATSFYGACILAYDIATGALIKRWSTFEATELNGYGAMAPVIYDGRIYCGTCDSNNYQGQYIVECDPSNGSINWWQPDYVVPGTNTNMRGLYHMKDGILAFMHYPYDVVLFDTVNHTWTVYNDDNVPGLTENYHILQYITQFAFDAANEMIMFGDTVNYSGRYGGAVMFSINGYINRTYYSVGTFSGGAWSWSTPANMVQGYMDYEGVPALDPAAESALFVFWTHRAVDGLLSIQWDKDGSAVNISKYLIGEIATEQSIGGAFATLSLTVSHGHLFDPYNHSSALSPVLKKGRTLTLRWGEDIGGTEYWQNCGTFYITAASMSFKRGEYPEMSVTAEDRRCEWTHSHVYVTEIYNNLPDYIIKDILTANAGLTAGEINISAFVGGIAIQMQWIETTIDEIINQVCERFGYYFRFDADGKANCRQIRNTAAPDHTYADSTKIIHYTPDDKYSDFTNRITVRGQSLLFTTVTYPEERITSISGTLGWWGCKGTHQIWFSDDKSRRCINPRMEIIESSCSMAMSLAGSIEEYLEECPEAGDDKYCTIHAEAPNLVAQLISCAAGYMAACAIPDGVTVLGFIASGGFTISIGRLLEGVSMFCIVNILGAVANYQYEVWAQPLGEIRQSVQGQWNDEDHQVEINAVVEQVLDDPLCYTINDCQTVANFEGMVVQMQRRRISIEKIAHLQDEDGDTIRFVHPYSVQAMDLFVATLRRKFKKSEPDRNDGYFLDEIEGWVLA